MSLGPVDPNGNYSRPMADTATFNDVTIGYLPEGLETDPSEFEFTWGEVDFVQRVWERATDKGHRVQLQIVLMNSDRLTDIDSLIEFLAEYHEKQIDQWELAQFTHADGPARVGDRRRFWLTRPGLAVQVRDPFDEVGAEELAQIAHQVRLGWEK